jgi:hypothetical protein
MESPMTIPMRRVRLFSEATLELLVATGNLPSLLWSSVAMGVADIIFRPSLLTSQADDVGAARHYYVQTYQIKPVAIVK